MTNNKEDLVRLKHILKAIGLIEKFSSDINNINQFHKNDLVQAAVTRQLEIIGEASANISEELKLQTNDIAWREIKDFRNAMIHEYFKIDIGLVWSAIEIDLPVLKEQITSLTEELNDE